MNPTTDPSRLCEVHVGQGFGAKFKPSTRRPKAYDSRASRRMRRQVVVDHIKRHGYVCPGWRRQPHPAGRFAADHIVPLIAGGGDTLANLRALCTSCNSRKSLHDRRQTRGMTPFAPS
jgi:5-methylcytosine-specific restriction endonuclease McrA